jgi:hypothetical protein
MRCWIPFVALLLVGCVRAGFSVTDAPADHHVSDRGLQVDQAADAPAGPAPFACDPSDSSLAACYSFEGSIVDGSANGNDPSTVTAAGYAAGVDGQALDLSAQSSVVVPDHASLNISKACTVELWFRMDQLPPSSRWGLIDKHAGFGIFVNAVGQVDCFLYPYQGVTGKISAGKWTHVACSGEGTTARLYVDGVLTDTQQITEISTGTNPMFIGANSPNGDQQFVGRIDNLRVWNSVRTPAQICAAAHCP